jgi:uncharacterized membrane protein YbhN (UPF0104 family)
MVNTAREQEAADQAPSSSRATFVKVAVRLVVGGAVIAILLARSDLGSLADAIGRLQVGYLLAAFGVLLAFISVGAFRWQVFLNAVGIRLRAPTVVRMYFVGTFFNAFLPTGMGGDAYKAVRLRKAPGSLAAAFATVFLDRLAGGIGLGLIGLGALATRLAADDSSRTVLVGAALSGLVLLGIFVVLVFGPRFVAEAGPEGRWGVRGRVRRTAQLVLRGGRDLRALRWGATAGLVSQGLALGVHVLLARGLGLDVPVAALALVMVFSQVATLIPLTLNGLGFREGAYVWGLAPYGVGHDPALAFALLMLALLLASSAVGGLVYVVAGGEIRGPVVATEGEV